MNAGTVVLLVIMVAMASLCFTCLIIMFSKYASRTKFGVYDPVLNPSIPHQSLLTQVNNYTSQPYIVYLEEVYVLNETNIANNDSRSLKVLTQTQVDELFPEQTYQNWINGGGKEESSKRNKNKLQILSKLKVEDDEDLKPHDHVNIEMKELHFDSGVCAICLDDLALDDIIRGLICGHVFHQKCIDPWLTQRRKFCPNCKKLQIEEEPPKSIHDMTLDEIVGVSHDNPNAFFLIACLTKFKALVLLSALEMVKINHYDNQEQVIDAVSVDDSLRLYDQPIIKKDGTIKPDLTHLNGKIKEIVVQRPFDANNLLGIDELAYAKASRFCSGFRKQYLGWIDVSFEDIYYLNVIKCYEAKKAAATATATAASTEPAPAATTQDVSNMV